MSTWKQKYNKKHSFAADAAHSLEDIAKTTGIKKSILQQVYNRGTGAWKSNIASVRLKSGRKDASAPRSAKMGKEQWSMGRVLAFVMKNPKQVGKGKPDNDLWTKHLMDEHKAHHTPKHMALMRRLIKDGKSFAQAHRQAMKDVGK